MHGLVFKQKRKTLLSENFAKLGKFSKNTLAVDCKKVLDDLHTVDLKGPSLSLVLVCSTNITAVINCSVCNKSL